MRHMVRHKGTNRPWGQSSMGKAKGANGPGAMVLLLGANPESYNYPWANNNNSVMCPDK